MGARKCSLNNGYVFYEQDIRNVDAVSNIIRRESIDTCIHMVAKTNIAESIDDPFTTIDVNVGGTLSMLEACSRNGVSNFIYVSSAAVYGEASKLPWSRTGSACGLLHHMRSVR